MAFPTIEAQATSAETTVTSTHTVSLPGSIVSGEKLKIFFAYANKSELPSTPSGWNLGPNVDNTAGAGAELAVYERTADGTEGSTVTINTTSTTRSAHLSQRISGASTTLDSQTATGTNTNADPPSLTPSGGALDYLFQALGVNSHGGTYSAYPTNYTNGTSVNTAGTASLHRLLGVARRNLNTAGAEDPSAFAGADVAAEMAAATIAIHPSAGATLHELDGSVGGTATIAGTAGIRRVLTGTATGVGTVAGSLLAIRTLTGSVTGSGTLAGTLEIVTPIRELTGTITGTGSLTGDLTPIRVLSGNVAGAGTLTGTLLAIRDLTGSVLGTGTLAGTLSIISEGTFTSGSEVVQASVEAPLKELTGSLTGIGTVSGNLVRVGALAGSVTGSGSLTASLTAVRNLTGSVEGTATLDADLTPIRGLSGGITGVGSASGTLTIVEAGVQDLTGTLTGTGTVSGSLTATRALSGVVTGTGSLTGILGATRLLTGSVEGFGALAGQVIAVRTLTGGLTGAGTLSGNLTKVVLEFLRVEHVGAVAVLAEAKDATTPRVYALHRVGSHIEGA